MKSRDKHEGLDELVRSLAKGSRGADSQLRAFLRVFEEGIALPCSGLVAGAPVQVLGFAYDGNARRGLTARCRYQQGPAHAVSAADVVMAHDPAAARLVAAYRCWLGLEAEPEDDGQAAAPVTGGLVELVVLSVHKRAARCRVAADGTRVTLRPAGLWNPIPGEIASVRPSKRWANGRTCYISGTVEAARVDAGALGLTPLDLKERNLWDPAEHYWGEPGEPIEEWAKPIIAHGPRRASEMEQVLPGLDEEDPFSDPIVEANDLKDAGDTAGALKALMGLCEADLRCLDAHAHLGNLSFDDAPRRALRHYEMGFRIGSLSLGPAFDGVLPWGRIDNRPFLRCMNGYGLCLWRLGRLAEALEIFGRMLWLNPSDNLGIRMLIDDVRAGLPWRED